MTITQPSGVDKSYRCPLTLSKDTYPHQCPSCMLYYNGKKKTAIGVGNKFSFGGVGTDLKHEYYFMRHHEWSPCSYSLVYCGPPTK